MATIFLERTPNRSLSAGDEVLYPSTARSIDLLVRFLLGIIPQPGLLGLGHRLFSLLCVQLVLEKTPTALLRISQARRLMAC